MSPGRPLALAAFAIRTNWRARITVGGLGIYLMVAAVAVATESSRGGGWSANREILFYGFVAGALFVIRSGLEDQREGDLVVFLRHNLVRPIEHATGTVVSLAGTWLLYCLVAFAVSLLASGGDAAMAAWIAWTGMLRGAILLPFVPVVETSARLRIPFLVPALGYLVLMVVLSLVMSEERMVAILGTPGDQGDYIRSLSLAARAAAVSALGFGGFIGAAALRGSRHRKESEVVPHRH